MLEETVRAMTAEPGARGQTHSLVRFNESNHGLTPFKRAANIPSWATPDCAFLFMLA